MRLWEKRNGKLIINYILIKTLATDKMIARVLMKDSKRYELLNNKHNERKLFNRMG